MRARDEISLSDGHVTFDGVTVHGAKFDLDADVEAVYIVSVVDDDVREYFSDTRFIPTSNQEFYLKFKIKDNGEQYRVQVETVDVERTVRVAASDRTTKAIEAARVLAGVPEDAKFRFDYRYDGGELRKLDEAQPVDVQFVWMEKVVKR